MVYMYTSNHAVELLRYTNRVFNGKKCTEHCALRSAWARSTAPLNEMHIIIAKCIAYPVKLFPSIVIMSNELSKAWFTIFREALRHIVNVALQ